MFDMWCDEQCECNCCYDVLCVVWVYEMVVMLLLFIECMMLFWYGYFMFGQDKVLYLQMMVVQNVLFCCEVFGNFGMLLYVVVKDLVMFQYFDGVSNCKGWLNENFVCEVMELFMFGEGYYM